MEYGVYLAHHGVKGQRWGIHRYQNPDGTLTEAGKKRYMKTAEKLSSDYEKRKEKSLKKHTAKALMHPNIYSKKVVREKQASAIRSAKKANKSLEKASKFFEEGLKDLSSKGLSSSDVKRFSELGSKILERKDLQDRFSRGEESAFWKIYAEQLAYGQARESKKKK